MKNENWTKYNESLALIEHYAKNILALRKHRSAHYCLDRIAESGKKITELALEADRLMREPE